MPTVGKKKYPYTRAGKAAAKAARAKKGAKGLGKAAGKIGRRTPAQMKQMGAAMKRASNKRKAGRGYKK